ncbi:hypothetical protein [Clostridium folliculivorans]|uniref:hypothetical protein n=1 Tax=Clostridium folliculivorans TaxID=2886038 RepID=UPI0021C43FA5|nr:hypothetical protein [Clostridium folliculivorans]GKU29305.1 hypothetical protein CFB3_14110 [Clostridium folliculivorans]
MVVTVTSKDELKTALKNKENTIVVKGKLAKKIKPLSILKKSNKKINIDKSASTAVAAGALVGIPIAVAITLIVTLGIVAIVAILNDYRMVVRNDEIVLERN